MFNSLVSRPYHVLHGRAIAFDKVHGLDGRILPDSFLGPKSIAPDHAVLGRAPGIVQGPGGLSLVRPDSVRLVVEVLSADTWRSDLGSGTGNEVDKLRTYREAGVPEYWVLNPSVDRRACPIPARSGRFFALSQDGSSWEEMEFEGGVVRSRAIPEVALDLDAFWRDCML